MLLHKLALPETPNLGAQNMARNMAKRFAGQLAGGGISGTGLGGVGCACQQGTAGFAEGASTGAGWVVGGIAALWLISKVF
jgi:hypothetical protein